jgi:hypothetical protein
MPMPAEKPITRSNSGELQHAVTSASIEVNQMVAVRLETPQQKPEGRSTLQ